MTELLDNERLRCPRDFKLLDPDLTDRAYRCENCGYTEQFGLRRTPLVTAQGAKTLVAEYRRLRAEGKQMPTRRAYGPLATTEVTR